MINGYGAIVEWDIDMETRMNSEESCPSVTLSITNPTRTDQDAKPCLHGERPVTNRLSYGMAFYSAYDISHFHKWDIFTAASISHIWVVWILTKISLHRAKVLESHLANGLTESNLQSY
jgi:hypothetical protein